MPRTSCLMKKYQHILLAVDLSPESADIGARAVELAQFYDARLSLLHVFEYMPVDAPNDLILPPQTGVEENVAEDARGKLQSLATQLGVPDANCRVEIGTTKHEILRIAEQENVDLIVIGSHGRSGWARLLGSSANAVLQAAPCDVVAIRVAS